MNSRNILIILNWYYIDINIIWRLRLCRRHAADTAEFLNRLPFFALFLPFVRLFSGFVFYIVFKRFGVHFGIPNQAKIEYKSCTKRGRQKTQVLGRFFLDFGIIFGASTMDLTAQAQSKRMSAFFYTSRDKCKKGMVWDSQMTSKIRENQFKSALGNA